MDAIGPLPPQTWEKKENPQTYELLPAYGEHPVPAQNILGVVGGNEVPYKNRQLQVELESDLRGITRANTFCPSRQFQAPWIESALLKSPLPTYTQAPPKQSSFRPDGLMPLGTSIKEIVRENPKQNVRVPVVTTPLQRMQMWAYPASLAPEPFAIESCMSPEKY